VVRLVKGADYVSLEPDDTLLHLAPLSFDASTFELWGALLNGGRVALLPPGQPSLAEIGEAIRRHRVTTLWLTSGLFHLMVEERLDDLKPLRQLLAGGDILSAEHLARAHRALPHCRLVNGYGPTENTTFTCCYTISDERELRPVVPIGRPIANTRAYVLDRYLQPVAIGVAGMLYAGGDGVARGYWRRPELTAERFLPDPYSEAPGARMYCTGDLASYRPDGNIRFLGRLDGQIKLRGHRVEPGEIEAVLSSHPAVRQAAVVVAEETPGDKRLIACVVPADASAPGAEPLLRALLREHLPEFMQPAAYVMMEQLPLTPNGKLDRRLLPQIFPGFAGTTRSHEPPRDDVERALCRIWSAVLGIEHIGIDDDFFELGGHSLLAVRLFSRLHAALGRALPLATLFRAPTVRALARFYRTLPSRWKVPLSSRSGPVGPGRRFSPCRGLEETCWVSQSLRTHWGRSSRFTDCSRLAWTTGRSHSKP
jgi:aspartate racemase